MQTDTTPVAESPATPAPDPDQEVVFEYEGQPITRAEARNGYMRTATFTQKTQQVAELRKEAETALDLLVQLENNPGQMISALSEHYQVAPPAPPEVDELGQPVQPDPLKQEVEALRTQVQMQAQEQTRAAVQKELDDLQALDPSVDLVLVADKMKTGNFPTLTDAYKVWKAEQLLATQTQATEATTEQDPVTAPTEGADTAAVVDEKRGLQGVISTGDGTAEAATSTPTPDRYENPAAAVADSIRSLREKGLLVDA